MVVLIAAVVSALTSVLVVVITHVLAAWQAARTAREQELEQARRFHINPLRLSLVENHFRLTEILRWIQAEGDHCEALLAVKRAEEVSDKDAAWFNGQGCYLISSCYFTACLFAVLARLRSEAPFLRLASAQDTRLVTMALKVSLGFLQDGGVYYATQPSLGEDLRRADGSLVSYREFCQLLREPSSRVWMDRLITFYLETGLGRKLDRVTMIIAAIQELSDFLDQAVGGGASIRERLEAERVQIR